MLVNRKTWQCFGFARRTDPKQRVMKLFESVKDADLVWNFEPEEVRDKNFAKHAEIPPDGYKVDQVVQDRVKQFYIDRDIRGNVKRTEFLTIVHDFEVYIRDEEMFQSNSPAALDENGEACGVGVGYKGVFQVENSAFDLRQNG